MSGPRDVDRNPPTGEPNDGLGADLRGLSLGDLESEITGLAANLTSAQARWLGLVSEFDRREGWAGWGMRSCAEWLAWRCSLSPRTARDQVRVARALRELPLIRSSFAEGILSYSKVRALTRIAEPETEADLIEFATLATAAQLESSVRSLEYVDSIAADDREARRHVSWFWAEDGCLELRAILPPEEGAGILRALEVEREHLEALADESDRGSAEPAPDEPFESRLPRVTNADAFTGLADAALSRLHDGRGPPGERRQVVLHLDLAADHAYVEGGPSLSRQTARRFGCDASVIASLERDGETLSLGRRTRTVSSRLRRAISDRDGGSCGFPGCQARRYLDAHHIRHWQDGGETSLGNLVLLCRRHHRLCHEGGCSIEQLPTGRLRFRDAHSRELVSSPSVGGSARRSGTAPPGASSEGAAGCGPLAPGTGERLNRGYAVDALLDIRARGRSRRRRGGPPAAASP